MCEKYPTLSKRIASLMARVAKSNDKVATQLLWLTIAIAAMTLVILVYTVLMWRQNENKPNQTVDSTATRVTSPAGQEPRHGQP
jgi:flagellar basal body-associated protein FliL